MNQEQLDLFVVTGEWIDEEKTEIEVKLEPEYNKTFTLLENTLQKSWEIIPTQC